MSVASAKEQTLKAVRLTLRSVLHTGQGPVFGVAVADTLADGVGARNSGSGEHDSGVGAGLDQVGCRQKKFLVSTKRAELNKSARSETY